MSNSDAAEIIARIASLAKDGRISLDDALVAVAEQCEHAEDMTADVERALNHE